MLCLEHHDVSPTLGFLSNCQMESKRLPGDLADIRDTAMELPRWIVSGKLRSRLADLPCADLGEFLSGASLADIRAMLVHYTFLVQAYVWGEQSAPTRLPACLAKPTVELARSAGQPPLLTYANYVLDNWQRLNPDGPVDLSNLYMVQPFLGGQDEAWFVLVHVAIEAKAAAMLREIPAVMSSVERGDDQSLERSLSVIAEVWVAINGIFDRMPERCDPYVYFHRVRPWIHGWKDNPALTDGLVYEGVTEWSGAPKAFRGQTGSQSSIVPTMDALLGIGHASDPLRVYLDELHDYRPPGHRAFVDKVRQGSRLRAYVEQRNRRCLSELYNDCVLKLTAFRTKHLEYAASYINKQNRGESGNSTEIGTGGTPFMKYLKKHRDEAQAHLL